MTRATRPPTSARTSAAPTWTGSTGFVRGAVAAGARPRGPPRPGRPLPADPADRRGPGVEILTEEVFGPVLTLQTFSSKDEAIALANSTPYGLAATVFTGVKDRAERISPQLVAGTVWVNCTSARPWRPSRRRSRPGSARSASSRPHSPTTRGGPAVPRDHAPGRQAAALIRGLAAPGPAGSPGRPPRGRSAPRPAGPSSSGTARPASGAGPPASRRAARSAEYLTLAQPGLRQIAEASWPVPPTNRIGSPEPRSVRPALSRAPIAMVRRTAEKVSTCASTPP